MRKWTFCQFEWYRDNKILITVSSERIRLRRFFSFLRIGKEKKLFSEASGVPEKNSGHPQSFLQTAGRENQKT